MISVQHNMLAENANRQLNINTKKNAKTAEKLASGYRINRAADDAAGLAISEKMRRQVRGLGQGAENIKDGIGYVQTAEGALNEAQDILQRINQLSVQAANGTNTVSDRAYINSEVQALKAELSRIFSTTTFNEERIWEPDEVPTMLDPAIETAVIVHQSGTVYGGLMNDNCGVLPMGGMMDVRKGEDGITVGWRGYNGTDYSTKLIPWEDVIKNNYSFNVSDYFKESDKELWPNGQRIFSYGIKLDVHENATFQQVKDAIPDGILMDQTIAINGKNESGSILLANDGSVYVSTGRFMYLTAYDLYCQGKFDFDKENDDPFIVPNKIANNGNSNLILYPDDASRGNRWSFSFEMDGIGTVTATSSSVSYSSRDDNPVWWYHDQYGNRTAPHPYAQNPTTGTLQDVLNTLTANPKIGAPGLLTDSTSGGVITVTMNLRDAGGDTLGYFYLNVNVFAGDTESTVSNRVTNALNGNTVLDLHTVGDSAYFNSYTSPSGWVEIPVYGETILQGKENFWVQAGAEAGQHIDIEYESLSLYALGMQDTDVLTAESASRAINEVKGALQVVSDQRSLFGAYQNRLEHAYNINKNVEENTQASESLIRDTDIADAMMEYSINNILLQAGTSMLTQANQSSQLITQLLG